MAKKEQQKPSKKSQKKVTAKAKKAGAKAKKTAAPAKKAAAPKKKAVPKKKAAAKPAKATKSFSVATFADMTYLTENGVMQWLRQGLLKGHQNAEGQWQIDASNLEVPNVKRLLR